MQNLPFFYYITAVLFLILTYFLSFPQLPTPIGLFKTPIKTTGNWQYDRWRPLTGCYFWASPRGVWTHGPCKTLKKLRSRSKKWTLSRPGLELRTSRMQNQCFGTELRGFIIFHVIYTWCIKTTNFPLLVIGFSRIRNVLVAENTPFFKKKFKTHIVQKLLVEFCVFLDYLPSYNIRIDPK